MAKERRLGRGLAALLGDNEPEVRVDHASGSIIGQATTAVADPPDHSNPEAVDTRDADTAGPNSHQRTAPNENATAVPTEQQLLMLGVFDIDNNPFQPRREFSESEIVSLAESLKEHDMLQPILVRRVGQRWQLISGERRLRAAIRAGWQKVPARVRQADDRFVAELAIVENLQRKDLNPIEKALSFRRYLDEHHSTQDDLAKRLKIDRSTIANLLRLLDLPESIQGEVQTGTITAGHARALLPLADSQLQLAMAEQIREQGLSVRNVERLVSEQLHGDELAPTDSKSAKNPRKQPSRSAHLASLEQRLRLALGTKIDIRTAARGKGQIIIHFNGNEEFERISASLAQSSGTELRSFAG